LNELINFLNRYNRAPYLKDEVSLFKTAFSPNAILMDLLIMLNLFDFKV